MKQITLSGLVEATYPADFTIRSDGVCRLNPELAKSVVTRAETLSEIGVAQLNGLT